MIEDRGYGIVTRDSNGNQIEKNYVANSGVHGIDIKHGTANAVINNEVVGSHYFGIGLGGGSNSNLVDRNSVSGSGWCGISIDGTYGAANDNRVSNNIVIDSAYNGIHVYAGSSYNLIEANTVTRSGWNGIAIFGGSSYNGIFRNIVSISTRFDLYSDGTGTDNVWLENVFTTQYPPALQP
jgi:parallel beta-helix repeat protein